MNEIKRLEMLSESIKNEVDELQSFLEHSDEYVKKAKSLTFTKNLQNIISNLESANDSVYGVFEELNAKDNETLQSNYNILVEILNDKLSHEERIYIKLKHNIEL